MERITEKKIKRVNLDQYIKITQYPLNLNLDNFTQKYYNFINELIEIPKCLECNKSCKFTNNLKTGYHKFCSVKCSTNSKEVKNKISRTNMNKYGVTKFNNSKKRKETNLKKYGVENVSQINEIKEKIKKNNIKTTKNGNLNKESFERLKELLIQKTKTKKASKKSETKSGLNFINGNPFYESSDSNIKIYQNDVITFLRTLPSNSVDLIITDPAYSGMNQRLKLGRGKIIGVYKNAGEKGAKWFEEFHDTEENYKAFLQECYRVLNNNRHIYIMFDSFSLLSLAAKVREIFEVKNLLCWDKMNIGLGHYFRRRHEFIMFASKGKRNLNSKNIPDVWRIKRVTNSTYPTQKPTEVFELMIKGSADKNFVVCDPFLGSGSSAIAAIKNNCKFIGCDISETSVSFSKKRIIEYLKTGKDISQKNSLIGDDELMIKLLKNGKS